jgi:dehydrogenase/reductase SDR family protein 12
MGIIDEPIESALRNLDGAEQTQSTVRRMRPAMTVLHERIEVARPGHEVFAYISDFSTTEEWDATVTRAKKLTPGPVDLGTRFFVNCAAPVGSIDLEYEVTDFRLDQFIELQGKSRFFDICDRITFTPTERGTLIDYRAEFVFPSILKGMARRFERGLRRMGKHSMEGMRAALEKDYPVPEASKLNHLSDRLLLPGLVKFTTLGYRRGRRKWVPNSAYLGGKHIVITGATAGLGYAAAMELARRGAHLTLVARDKVKGQGVLEEIRAASGNDKLRLELADLSLLDEVDKLVRRLRRRGAAIDVLVNNAGALFNTRQETAEGIEQSLALLLLGPCRLTEGLKPLLAKAGEARVINVVSGGMYTQKLDLSRLLEEKDERYSGSVAYARAKRALMVVTEAWAEAWADDGIVVNAMHPGWADTPGVKSALPVFHRLTKHVLRTPEEGADTIVWLASAREAGKANGKLFLDREPHATHLLPFTRESAEERQALLDYLAATARPPGGSNAGAALVSGA